MKEQLCRSYATNCQRYHINEHWTWTKSQHFSWAKMTFWQRDCCAFKFFGVFNKKSFYQCLYPFIAQVRDCLVAMRSLVRDTYSRETTPAIPSLVWSKLVASPRDHFLIFMLSLLVCRIRFFIWFFFCNFLMAVKGLNIWHQIFLKQFQSRK